MNTTYDRFTAWAGAVGHDLRMCVGILAIWFASAVLPVRHPCQPHLKAAVQAMDEDADA